MKIWKQKRKYEEKILKPTEIKNIHYLYIVSEKGTYCGLYYCYWHDFKNLKDNAKRWIIM